MSGRLSGKVVVIIGGTSGLGASAAAACVGEGAQVVLVGRSPEKVEGMQRQLGSACAALVGDAEQAACGEAAVALAWEAFGGLDALYHVAGGSGRRFGDGPLDQVEDAAWDKVWSWNLRSAAFSNRAAVRSWLKHQRGGVVLNMSSVLAFSPSPEHFATHAYAAAKAGIIGLTKACAAYYAAHGIRFHAIAPGLVRTPMAARAEHDPEIQRYIRGKQPLAPEGMCRSDDLNGAVVYLLSDESAMMTGQVLVVDGGWTLSEGGQS